MKRLTERELAEVIERADKENSEREHGVEECYRVLARAAAEACGYELTPEGEPAQRWPEWWGEKLLCDGVGWVYRKVFGLNAAVVVGDSSDRPRPEVIANRRALVAAYEAAREAGVLPGMTAQGDNPWLNQVATNETAAYCRYQAQRNRQMADLTFGGGSVSWKEPGLVGPEEAHKSALEDAEIARRARAVQEWAKLRHEKAGHSECLCNLCQVLRILRGESPASDGGRGRNNG